MIEIFLIFMKIGLLGFGGGSAIAPIIQKELINKRGWIKEEELLKFVAVANALPGPAFTQIASECGYRHKGYKGMIAALLGSLVVPVYIFLFGYLFLQKIVDPKALHEITKFITPVIIALILQYSYNLFKNSRNKITKLYFFITLIICLILLFINLNPSLLIILFFILYMIRGIKK